MQKSLSLRTSAVLVALAATLTACGSADDETSSSPSVTERARATPRVVVSYDGGLRVLDGKTLEHVADLQKDGFLRLNPAGDDRHVIVTTDAGFEVLDSGTWREEHGDHAHFKVSEPRFTGARFGGSEPGHAVAHDNRLTLFFDGTGEVKTIDRSALGDTTPDVADYRTPHAHHGVAVSRGDGSLVVTDGDQESRSGIRIVDAEQKESAASADCPGVHGEAAASGGVLTFGCQNGILVVRGNSITKVASPDAYGRIGNQAGSDESPIVLGDYKTRPSDQLADDEIERPRRFSLTDTRTGSLRIVDLPTSYSFRSLARGQDGQAMILGTDGAVYVFDPETGRQTARHQVIDPWTEPVEWQEPMPSIDVVGGTAYVSDPKARTLTALDIYSGKQTARAALDVAVIETAAVSG